ncbi:hypothetical protein B296_00027848 [Ensete ventricosum]|uniref:Uncharacterized protein n=1 Tax=Ensete ventricosum TaxID=4639 RepID=A0A427ABX1_ENSVE|nr:hypothetical protein B296_00027848 [Ensete ventricosum]
MLPPKDKREKCYDASPVRVGRQRQSARDSRRLTAVPLQKQEQEGYRIPIPPALTCPSFCSFLLMRNRRYYLLSVPIPSSISGSPLRSNDQGDYLSPLVHDGHSSPLASSSLVGPRRLSHSFTEASFYTRPSSSYTTTIVSAPTGSGIFPTPYVADDGFYTCSSAPSLLQPLLFCSLCREHL